LVFHSSTIPLLYLTNRTSLFTTQQQIVCDMNIAFTLHFTNIRKVETYNEHNHIRQHYLFIKT